MAGFSGRHLLAIVILAMTTVAPALSQTAARQRGQQPGAQQAGARQEPRERGAADRARRGAQRRDSARRDSDRARRPQDRVERRRERALDQSRPALERVLGQAGFRPGPEDFEPLRPGEERELNAFVRSRLPELWQDFQRARQRNPRLFEQRLRELLPRLRSLQRIAAENPGLGRRMIRHMQNTHAIRRAARAWNDQPARQARIRALVRARVAENVRLEIEAVEEALADFEADRQAYVERFLELLDDPDANLAAEPAPLRRAAERLRATEDPSARAALRAELGRMAERRLEREISSRRERLERRRANASQEVEEAYARVMARIEQRPPQAGP